MTDETQPTPPTSAPATKEIEDGKVFAILSYALSFVGLPFFLAPLIMRDNDFALYHAKQCLVLWLVGIVVMSATWSPFFFYFYSITHLLSYAFGVFLVILNIIGLINALNSATKPVPVLGKFAEDWFKNIKKVNS
jgi:uncharacterized membrane protein